MSDTLVKVENVSKKFCRNLKRSLWYGMKDLGSELLGRSRDENEELRPHEFWAVNDVSFDLKRGECLGLIGRNGAGKTTLLRMLNGLIKPDQGRVEMRGRIGALIALGAGFNPILTGRENIYVNATVLGLSKNEIDAKLDEIISFAELEEFIDTPVQSYSSGMVVRLGFSIATTLSPDILILDEVLAVGDVSFRVKCWQRIGDLSKNAAVILVSHEAYAIHRLCNQALFLDKGMIQFKGNTHYALDMYSKSNQPSSTRPKILNFCHETVTKFQLITLSNNLNSGDNFEFDMIVEMKASISVDYAFINLQDSTEDIYAQTLLDFPKEGLLKGINNIHITIEKLYLPKNRYYIVMWVNSFAGKEPILISRNDIYFDLQNHVSYGPKYYPIGKVSRKTTKITNKHPLLSNTVDFSK